MKFIVDENVGRLAKWLRLMGYDTVFFHGDDDAQMVRQALKENRVLLTRDTQIMKRGVITRGRLRAVLIARDAPDEQMRQVVRELNLDCHQPFSLCLECNQPLVERVKEEIKDRVPAYVFRTQQQYMECPQCRRIYWRGTHWQAMTRKLTELVQC